MSSEVTLKTTAEQCDRERVRSKEVSQKSVGNAAYVDVIKTTPALSSLSLSRWFLCVTVGPYAAHHPNECTHRSCTRSSR